MRLFELNTPMGHHGDTWCKINAMGLAEFDVAFVWGRSEVVLRVPNLFDMKKWMRDVPETVTYQLTCYEHAAKFRRGERGV